jgi:hypothetical protein
MGLLKHTHKQHIKQVSYNCYQVISVKIHDALILEFIKPDKTGKPTGEIIKAVGTANIKYRLEQLVRFARRVSSPTYSVLKLIFGSKRPEATIIEEMTPDIVVRRMGTSKEKETVVFELETDVDFDFGKSLRQIKNYQRRFDDVRVIIPREYESFASLYKNDGFRVWIWRAIRVWQCLRCASVTEKEGAIPPKCEDCKKYTKHRLIGLKAVRFTEFL